MNALINISEQNGKQAVDARELHSFLENGKRFTDWMKLRIGQYEFSEGADYTSFHQVVKREKGASVRKEYALTISCAKELAMVEGNKKGKAARLYFIECERQLQTNSLQQRVNTLEAQVAELKRQLGNVKPVAKQKALPVGREFDLVQKHFMPAPVESGQFWTVQDALHFIQEAEQVKSLSKYRIGKALTRLCGKRYAKWRNNKSAWYYSATLTA